MLKRIHILLIPLLLIASRWPVFGSITAPTVFQVDNGSNGSSTNGGGFDSTLGGTDMSLGAATALTGLSSNSGGTVITCSSAASSWIGNMVYINTNTGWTSGWYQITAVSAGTSFTIDRSAGASASSGTAQLGGPLDSIGTWDQCMSTSAGAVCAGVFIKGGSGQSVYTITTATTHTPGGCVSLSFGGATAHVMRIVGYDPAVGRTVNATGVALANMPHIQLGSGVSSASIIANNSKTDIDIENLNLDGNAQTSSIGIKESGAPAYIRVHRCELQKFTNNALSTGAAEEVIACLIAGNTTTFAASGSGMFRRCVFEANTAGCINVQGGQTFCIDDLFYGNSGSDCIQTTSGTATSLTCVNDTFDSTTSNSGINVTTTNGIQLVLVDSCLFTSNGAYGVKCAGANDSVYLYNDAFWNNATASYNNVTSTNAINIVTLTGSPYASGANNYALNNTSGAGAACRAAGIPGAFVDGNTTGYLDIGAAQHQDSGGSVTGTKRGVVQ